MPRGNPRPVLLGLHVYVYGCRFLKKVLVWHVLVLPRTPGENLGLRIRRWRRFGVVILYWTPPWSP